MVHQVVKDQLGMVGLNIDGHRTKSSGVMFQVPHRLVVLLVSGSSADSSGVMFFCSFVFLPFFLVPCHRVVDLVFLLRPGTAVLALDHPVAAALDARAGKLVARRARIRDGGVVGRKYNQTPQTNLVYVLRRPDIQQLVIH